MIVHVRFMIILLILRSTCTNSLPRYFHYQPRRIAATLEFQDLSYPNEILRAPVYCYADRSRKTILLCKNSEPRFHLLFALPPLPLSKATLPPFRSRELLCRKIFEAQPSVSRTAVS